jgi:DNA-binding NarL/FixJ family response regulator
MTGPVRVLIADDHPVVRSGLASVLASQADFEVVGEAANGADAVLLTTRLQVDLVLMDLRMPIQDGVSAIQEIVRAHPEVRVVVLTTYATDGEIVRAIEAGAVGYLLKDIPHEELFRALRAVARGERYLTSAVTARVMTRWRRSDRLPLTARELEVLRCVAQGESNKAIASSLGISEPTVKAHLVHVFDKLGVDNRTAAVRAAMDRGIIEAS